MFIDEGMYGNNNNKHSVKPEEEEVWNMDRPCSLV
jgi:hypothetical protein